MSRGKGSSAYQLRGKAASLKGRESHRIGVIGAGTIGRATAESLERLGHTVVIVDKDDSIHPSEVYFICTPEDAVSDVISRLKGEGVLGSAFVVIRSTTLPGTTEGLAKEYKLHISHMPEFLREATAIRDELNPWRVVIGECCQEHGGFLEELFAPLCCPIIRVDPRTSEMVKLACNAHLATLISFWNEISGLCAKIEVNSHLVGRVSSLDPRISSYGATMHGKAFGGRCLPKDLRHLIQFAHDSGHHVPLLEATERVNTGFESGNRL
jgi:nucleotide sugar dehydrogenase